MFDKRKYDRQFDKENYHHINLVLPKDYKELLPKHLKKAVCQETHLYVMP